jgi:hypothetical protein
MKAIHAIALGGLIIVGMASFIPAAGPSDAMVRGAYKQVLAEADKNKDGQLSRAECKAMFKDSEKGEKNCGFWDADHDGTITEDEYVAQVMSMQRKK